MRRLLVTRTYTNHAGQYRAELSLESAEPAPNYLLELKDAAGSVVQRTLFGTLNAYSLKCMHGVEAKDALFSGAEAYVKEVQKDVEFQAWLKTLGL